GRLRPRGERAAAGDPACDVTLRHPAHHERAGWNVTCHGRTRAHVGVVTDRHRCHQLRVAADLHPGADRRAALLPGGAVVVAGDGTGSDVRVGADLAVTEVGEMVRLRAGADRGLLGLDEVAVVD